MNSIYSFKDNIFCFREAISHSLAVILCDFMLYSLVLFVIIRCDFCIMLIVLLTGEIIWYIIYRNGLEVYRDTAPNSYIDRNNIQPYQAYTYTLTVCNTAGCASSTPVIPIELFNLLV